MKQGLARPGTTWCLPGWPYFDRNTLRLTLLKIGAVIIRNTRRIRILLSSACPHQDLFRSVALRLNTS